MKVKTCPNGEKITYDETVGEFIEVIKAINLWIKYSANGTLIETGVWNTGNIGTTMPVPPTTMFANTAPKKIKKEVEQKPQREQDLNKIKMSDLFKYTPLSKYTGLEGKIAVRADTTYVGVEVELERVVVDKIPSGTWTTTEDGSLKDSGVEFVTIPIHFRFLEVELQRLFGGLKSCKTSTRCSVHVHLNARDFTLEELKSFIALYMIFEKSLYNFSGGRWNNNFCVPLYFNPHIVRYFVSYINENKVLPTSWFKYFGFNLCPLYGGESTCLGTIEFRHMKGNTDVGYIVNWINLIVSLKISAKKFSFEEIVRHLEVMNTTSGYYWLAKEVFKDFEGAITTQPTFKEDIESCITQTKTIFLQTKPGVEQLN